MIENIKKMNNKKLVQELGLYIHIPFCVKKCDYCDFLSTPASEEMKHRYVNALLTEIRSYQGKTSEYVIPSIFFGGGTPSSISAVYIQEIMEALHEVFYIDTKRLEATIEVNPESVTKEKLSIYKNSGINRISFGLQSTNNQELLRLGRIHNFEQFKVNYEIARTIGFHNINIDLMSGLPGQDEASWEQTLNQVIDLKPEHISAYSLMIEEGTPFFERYQENSEGRKELPAEETDRLIYHKTKEVLKENGYQRYEISNYARDGFICRHNSSYWIGTDYLGIGLGAASLLQRTRFNNTHDIEQYLSFCDRYNQEKMSNTSLKNHNINILNDAIGLRDEYIQLTYQQQIEEFMFLGLRMSHGINKKVFFERFNKSIDSIYGSSLLKLERDHLIAWEGEYLFLTDYGVDVSNVVLAEFLIDE